MMGAPGASAARPSFTMEVPSGWKQVEPDMNFYLAKYEIEGGGNCTVSWNTGDVGANLDRWYGQWDVPGGDVKKAAMVGHLEDANYQTVMVEISGTFTATRSVGGGPPREDWMLAGAILMDTPAGPVFVKAVGPRSVLGPELDTIKAMVARAEVHPGS